VIVALLRADAAVPVERLYREEGDCMRLEPENGDHEQLVLPAEDVRIQGRGVYVVRPSRRRAAGGGA
jgi:repressor LexA